MRPRKLRDLLTGLPGRRTSGCCAGLDSRTYVLRSITARVGYGGESTRSTPPIDHLLGPQADGGCGAAPHARSSGGPILHPTWPHCSQPGLSVPAGAPRAFRPSRRPCLGRRGAPARRAARQGHERRGWWPPGGGAPSTPVPGTRFWPRDGIDAGASAPRATRTRRGWPARVTPAEQHQCAGQSPPDAAPACLPRPRQHPQPLERRDNPASMPPGTAQRGWLPTRRPASRHQALAARGNRHCGKQQRRS